MTRQKHNAEQTYSGSQYPVLDSECWTGMLKTNEQLLLHVRKLHTDNKISQQFTQFIWHLNTILSNWHKNMHEKKTAEAVHNSQIIMTHNKNWAGSWTAACKIQTCDLTNFVIYGCLLLTFITTYVIPFARDFRSSWCQFKGVLRNLIDSDIAQPDIWVCCCWLIE